MSKLTKSILFIFLGLLVFGTVSFIATDVLKATTPTGVTMTLLKSELMTDAAAMPVTVVDKTADGGSPIDIMSADADKLFGAGTSIPIGTYKWLKLTVKNQISFAVAEADKCTSDTQTTQTFLIKSGEAADSAVVLYFAYGADSYSYWPSGQTTTDPFMMEHPLVVEAGKTTDVKIIFKMKDAVYCNSGQQSAMAPLVTDVVSSIIDADPPSDCTFAGDFWWIDYNMYGGSDKSGGSVITEPTLDQIMRRAGLNVGWGTVTFNNDGTWQVDPSKTVANGGMAEHQHGLTSFGSDGGYADPADPSSGAFTGNYTLSGSRIIMSMVDWYAEGAFTDDCSMFLVVNSSASDNNLIYGIKKTTSKPVWSSADTYVGVGPELGLAFSSPTTTADTTYIGYHNHFSASNSAKYFEWKTLSDYYLVSSGSGTITGFKTWGAQEMTGIRANDAGGTINDDGFIPSNEDFVAMGVNGELILAGRIPYSDSTNTIVPDETWTKTHGMSTGYSTPVLANPVVSDLSGTWSIAVLQSTVDAGTDTNWGSGDEGVSFGLSFGELALGSDGAVLSVNIFDKNLLTGLVTIAPFSADSITGPHTECYKPGTAITDTACTDGVKVPVFYLVDTSTDPDTVEAKLALAKNKKTLVFWSPIDVNDTPENDIGKPTCGFGSTTTVNDCSEQGRPHALNGIAIKIK